METLIPVLNKLQDVFARVGSDKIHLPQIAVVGCQSSGKSSVLESLVQKDFLPRGSGIVTRRPLILQLVHTDKKQKPNEWAEFLHCPDKKFTNFEDVRTEIEEETERLCGADKGISDAPINLKVYSPDVLELTLVDLPGLTKVSIEGQPADLPEQIRKMVLRYITPENAIILAITPANQDLANSDSLTIAREVDPEGNRTIGVLTKLDIMDEGTSAIEVLTNRVYRLKLGYIGVVNRSQRDIDTKKSMESVLEAERHFFRMHPAYREIASENGYDFLATTLNRILMEHIKKNLPSVHQEINELLRRKEKELTGYGSSLGDTIEAQQMYLYSAIEHYIQIYTSLLYGTSDQLRMNGVEGGQYLMDYLINELPKKMEAINPRLEMSRDRVLRLIEANSGLQRALFFPEETFHKLIREYVDKMRAPSVEAAEIVHHRMLELHSKVVLPELDRFPKVKQQLSQSIADIAREMVESCMQYINQLIDVQEAYINTEHPAFKERTTATLETGSLQNNVDLLLELVDRYFAICKKELVDAVPKGIHRILITQSSTTLRLKLFEKLVLQPDLAEDPDVALRRKKCLELIGALKEAASILNEVRMVHI